MATCTASPHRQPDRPLALAVPAAPGHGPATAGGPGAGPWPTPGCNHDALLERPQGCGWFDSSLDLAEGLTVCEADDGPLQWALAQLLFNPRPGADQRGFSLSGG